MKRTIEETREYIIELLAEKPTSQEYVDKLVEKAQNELYE